MSSSAVVVMILLVFALIGIGVVAIIRSVSSNTNNKMTICKTCGYSIAKSAPFCPYCGAKRPKEASLATVLLLVLFIVLVVKVANGTGSKTNNQSKPTVKSSSSQSNTNKQNTENQTYTIGDKLELDDIVITLKDVRINHGNSIVTPQDGYEFIIFEFDIENNSSRTLYASSYWDFDAYADDYILSRSIKAMMCDGGNRIGDSIDPGRKLNGIVGYEISSNWKNAEIIFNLSSLNDKKFTFTIDRSQVK